MPEAVSVDPGLAAASSREFIAGFEMEVLAGMPREAASGRTPWVHTFDARIAVHDQVDRGDSVTFQLEAFNLLDSEVMTHAAQGAPDEGALPAPARYQAPREVRLRARYGF